jgi:hypothetical protein
MDAWCDVAEVDAGALSPSQAEQQWKQGLPVDDALLGLLPGWPVERPLEPDGQLDSLAPTASVDATKQHGLGVSEGVVDTIEIRVATEDSHQRLLGEILGAVGRANDTGQR